MDEKQLDSLRSLDWEDIAAKVLRSAYVYAARYGWNQNSSLPKGNREVAWIVGRRGFLGRAAQDT